MHTWRVENHISYKAFLKDFLVPGFIAPSLELNLCEANMEWEFEWTPVAERLLAVALYTFGHHARSAEEIFKVLLTLAYQYAVV